MYNSLWSHRLKHARFPCPSLSPGISTHSCLFSHWCHPTILSSVTSFSSILPSIRVFFSGLAVHIRLSKYWSFSFSISPSSKYSGLISFRIDWFDLPAVQGTLKSLLQQHDLKVSILRHSAFFMVQLSLPYMTTGKAIALTIWHFSHRDITLLANDVSAFSYAV